MAEKRRVIYYRDELNDEFSDAVITPRTIDGSYEYCPETRFKKLTRFFWYRVVATPAAFVYTKLVLGQRTVGKKALRRCGETGYFIYGNHTQDIGDACLPGIINFPRMTYVIVHPNNVSIPGIGLAARSMGAIPLPDDMAAYRNFQAAIGKRIAQKRPVAIYPEAHIWPYYTKIRPFGDASFYYPVRENVPAFCFTNTYQKRRFSKRPRIVTYVDGPFFPKTELPKKQRAAELRDRVYETMCERAKRSDTVFIEYIKEQD